MMVFVEKSGAGNVVFKNAIFLRDVCVTFAQVRRLFGEFVWVCLGMVSSLCKSGKTGF